MTTQVPEHLPDGIEVLTSGIDVPEGPAWGPDGVLWFVAAGEGVIYRIAEGGEPERVATTGGRPNGLAFSMDGRLFVTDAGRQAVLSVSESGVVEVFADSHESRRFGGPNDLAFLPNGDLLFTDPARIPLPDPAMSPVYRVRPDGTTGIFVEGIAYPNGIDLAADLTGVFISEMRAHRLVRFNFDAQGNAMDEKLVRRFREPASPDGLAVDIDGRVLQALPGINSLAHIGPDGSLADLYYSPRWKPSNVTFGGVDMKTVFVTSEQDGTLYSFRVETPGVDLLHVAGAAAVPGGG